MTGDSAAEDTFEADGRKQRSEATAVRKNVLGKKHNRLDASKVGLDLDAYGRSRLMMCTFRRMTRFGGFVTY